MFTDLIATGERPWRLWAGAVPDLFAVLRASPGRSVTSHLARLSLYPLSLLNGAVGLTLAVIAVATNWVPVWVAAPAGAVAGQGMYTLAWLSARVPLSRRAAANLFVAGEVVALVVGSTGVVAAVANLRSSDPEYGPPTMFAIVGRPCGAGSVGLTSAPPRHDGDRLT